MVFLFHGGRFLFRRLAGLNVYYYLSRGIVRFILLVSLFQRRGLVALCLDTYAPAPCFWDIHPFILLLVNTTVCDFNPSSPAVGVHVPDRLVEQ